MEIEPQRTTFIDIDMADFKDDMTVDLTFSFFMEILRTRAYEQIATSGRDLPYQRTSSTPNINNTQTTSTTDNSMPGLPKTAKKAKR